MKKLMLSVFAVLALAGCASNYADKSSREVAEAVTVKNSEFDPAAIIIGPQHVTRTSRGLFTDSNFTQLVASVDKKSKEVKYFVHTSVLYTSGQWRFYQSASLADATQRDLKIVGRQVQSCTAMAGCLYTEDVSFQVDLSELGKLGQQGDFMYRLNSKSGTENVIILKREYINGFLVAVGLMAPKF